MINKKLYELEEKIADNLCLVSEIFSGFFLILLVMTVSVQVILRFFFRSSLPWGEELARYMMIWVVMLATGILVRNKELITVDFLDSLWPKKVIFYRDLIYRILLIFICYFFIKHGWIQAWDSRNTVITSMNLSWFWPYFAIPVGFTLMLIQVILAGVRDYYCSRAMKAEGTDN